MRRAAVGLAAAAWALPAVAAASGWSAGGSLGAAYDDNAGNAANSEDIRGTGVAFASLGVGWERRFSLFTALQLQGAASAEHVANLERLSNAGVSGRIRLLHKHGRGFHTPVLVAWVGAGAREFGGRIRDGGEYRAGASAAAPLTTAVQLRVEAQWTQADATASAFDLGYFSYALNADWLASPRITVYANLRLYDGEFTSSANRGRQYLEGIATAEVPDSAFGDGWWAYRVDGRMWITTFGINVPLAADAALDVQLRGSDAEASGFGYERWLGSVGVLFRW